MRKTVYLNLPKLKIDLTLGKAFIAIVAVLCLYAAPIYFINKSREPAPTGAQVAGVSTSAVRGNIVDFGFMKVDLNSQAGVFLIGGTLLMGLSIILILFLIIDDINHRRIRNRKKFY